MINYILGGVFQLKTFLLKLIGFIIIGLILDVIYILMDNSSPLYSLLNGISIIGLIYIVIGCALLVFFGGFFRGTAHSIKKFFRTKSDDFADQLWESSEAATLKKKSYDDLPNLKDGATPHQQQWIYSFLLAGLLFFIPALIVSYIYY